MKGRSEKINHIVTNKVTSDQTASANPVYVARQQELRNAFSPLTFTERQREKEREGEQEPRFLPLCSEQSLHR